MTLKFWSVIGTKTKRTSDNLVIFIQGYQTFFDGKRKEECPYKCKIMIDKWMTGWRIANKYKMEDEV